MSITSHSPLTERRAEHELWSQGDVNTAVMQESLLSYRSDERNAEIYGPRYVNSAPEDYTDNCPWNNWTPPSRSWAAFQAAVAANDEAHVQLRIRVQLLKSVDMNVFQIGFASVEDFNGSQTLILRRGAEIVAHFPLSTIIARLHPTQPNAVLLSPYPLQQATGSHLTHLPELLPVLFLEPVLAFEDPRRLNSFIRIMDNAFLG